VVERMGKSAGVWCRGVVEGEAGGRKEAGRLKTGKKPSVRVGEAGSAEAVQVQVV